MIDLKEFRDENNAILALGRTLQHIRAEDLKRILDALEATEKAQQDNKEALSAIIRIQLRALEAADGLVRAHDRAYNKGTPFGNLLAFNREDADKVDTAVTAYCTARGGK